MKKTNNFIIRKRNNWFFKLLILIVQPLNPFACLNNELMKPSAQRNNESQNAIEIGEDNQHLFAFNTRQILSNIRLHKSSIHFIGFSAT